MFLQDSGRFGTVLCCAVAQSSLVSSQVGGLARFITMNRVLGSQDSDRITFPSYSCILILPWRPLVVNLKPHKYLTQSYGSEVRFPTGVVLILPVWTAGWDEAMMTSLSYSVCRGLKAEVSKLEFILYVLAGPVIWHRIPGTEQSLRLKHAPKISICLFSYTKAKQKKKSWPKLVS